MPIGKDDSARATSLPHFKLFMQMCVEFTIISACLKEGRLGGDPSYFCTEQSRDAQFLGASRGASGVKLF